MKKLLFYVIAFATTLSFSSCGYNGMVDRDESVKAAWSQVENVYQRRMDLIPNLVNTVKGEANFEKSTLTEITEARASATQTNIKVDNLSPENIAKYQAAQDRLSSTLSRLLVASENYPNLKGNQAFRDLAAELERTEGRITIARKDFNDAVADYNKYIRGFPNNLSAGMFGFTPKGYFTAAAGADKAPTVKFE
jgi:LemA protein